MAVLIWTIWTGVIGVVFYSVAQITYQDLLALLQDNVLVLTLAEEHRLLALLHLSGVDDFHTFVSSGTLMMPSETATPETMFPDMRGDSNKGRWKRQETLQLLLGSDWQN